MEPQYDPVNLRSQSPDIAAAAQELYGGPGGKQRIQREQGDNYPAWVLDQMGVDVMLANRVALGQSIQPPRFRWVPYADALLFPLDNSALAQQNSDRTSFFALEDQLRQRYLKDAGMERPPATLSEYLARVVTPTLERHRQGGALAEKFEAAYLRSLAFDKVDRAEAGGSISASPASPVPPSPCTSRCSSEFLFCLNSSIAGSAYNAWARMGAGMPALLPPDRFHFDVLNSDFQSGLQ